MKSSPLTLDHLAIGASILCFLHCAFLPLAISIFPAFVATGLADEGFHQAILWFVVPSSMISVTLGCRHHKDLAVMVGCVVGLSALVLVAFWGHDLLGEFGEKVATSVAALVLALAHWRNFSLCHRSNSSGC